MTPERKAKRLELAGKISEKMFAARRADVPPDTEAHLWTPGIEMDTNKSFWYPKILSNEYDRLRFTEEGSP